MGKKILYIVLGALAVFGLLFLLWSWLFSDGATPAGTLGGAGNASSTLGSGANVNNGQTSLPSGTGGYNAQGVYVGPGNGAYDAQGNYAGIQNTQGGIGTTTGFTTVNGVTWLGSPFNPSDINSVAGGAGGFAPTITSSVGAPGSGNNLLTVLAGTAIAGSLSCAIQTGIIAISAPTAATAVPVAASMLVSVQTAPVGVAPGPLIVADYGIRYAAASSYILQASQAAHTLAKDNQGFANCIINVIAKTALQQITISVVNWINSGFNGQPSFVTNYQQFFTNVADASAGQFIQGAGLSFLCSPFKLQIKIAIAQSYANRNAQSCTLTKVIGNINNFMNGNFASGGWGGFVSFTTVPTNNPYGAFAYAQAGLASQQSQALSNAKNNISPTGFLNLQKLSGCTESKYNGIGGSASLGVNPQAAAAAGSAALPAGCKTQVITPGGAIADSLGAVNKSGIDQLGLGNDIDQIISALTTQLMTRMLQNGLPSLSQTTTQTPADIAAQSQALTMLNDMQSKTILAQQLGSIYQGSISDIENVQAGLSGLANCWSSVASSTNNTSAAQHAADANTTLQLLETQVTAFNDKITQINSAIAALNQFESQISMAASAADVATVAANYTAAVSAGTFPSQTDITTAGQDRVTLQSQLATTNQSTQTGLAQCNAAASQ